MAVLPASEEKPVQSLIFGLARAACPIGMGAMMWIMMRGRNKNTATADSQSPQQIEQLRAELDQLRADHATAALH